jgi:hypothetical protein
VEPPTENPVVIPDVIAAPVEAVKETFTVKAFPNPSSTDFAIQVISTGTEPIMIRIMDIQGIVKSLSTVASKTNLVKPGANLPAGTYMAEITQGQHKQVIKLVKLN